MTTTLTITEYPPLDPSRERERQFYHYRRSVVVGVIKLSDALALWRIEHGQDLWPVEWGLKYQTKEK